MISKIRERFGLLIGIIFSTFVVVLLANLLVSDITSRKPKTKSTEVVNTDSDFYKQIVFEASERAYFEGQRDALRGDIRIEQSSDSCYHWILSPWDEGKAPTFNPEDICGQY